MSESQPIGQEQAPTSTSNSNALRISNLDDSAVNQTLRFLAIVSYVLTVISNVRYNYGHRSPWDNGHQDDVGFTPFTASLIPIVLYWILTIVAQLVYLTKFFYAAPKVLNWQFVISNLLLLSWSYLFARGYYIFSEVLVILNFLQLLGGYLLVGSHRIRPLPNWLAIHGSVIVLPLIWSHYLIFWNGAVMIGARNLAARIVANVFIWEFLLVPGCVMLMTGDYLFGFASAWIVFAIGLGQLLTKVFALQWIFAFTIAALLLIGSIFLAFVKPDEQLAPPIVSRLRVRATDSNETAPLLTDP